MTGLIIAESILLLLVLVGYPLYSSHSGKTAGASQEALRGLNMPNGSVRAMLALLTVGSFVVVLTFGPGEMSRDAFSQVLAAFGALTGAVIGFYFGGRSGN